MGDASTYASYSGVKSVPAAAVFAGLYFLLLLNFIFLSFRRPSHVFYSLSFFCAVRVTSFILRAILAGPGGNDINLIIGDQVLFSIGFFSLLYSAYTLVLDREVVSEFSPSTGIISRIIRQRRLYKVALLIAIILGSVGISELNASNNASTISTGKSLHQASTIIFLVLVVLLAYQTLILAKAEFNGGGYKSTKGTFGARFGTYILLIISLLLVVREAFATAVMNDPSTGNNEHLWYPLIALPELLVVLLYCIPDIVPIRSELPKSRFC